MANALTITFSEKSCHVAVTTQQGDTIINVNQKEIAHDFEKIHELPNVISELKSLYLNKMDVKINIPAHHSMTCDIAVERNLSEHEIMQFLKSRAAQLFGHPAHQLCIDYEIKNQMDDQKQKITAIAAQTSVINDIQKYFSLAKIPINAIQINGNMNLLPWRKNKKTKHNQKILLNSLLALFSFIFLLFVLKFFLIYEMKQLKIKEKNDINDNQKIILDHPNQHGILLKKLTLMHSQKLLYAQSNNTTEAALAAIANTLPNAATLTGLTLNAKKMVLTGMSNQLESIHAYVNALQDAFKNKHTSLSEIHNDVQNKSQIDFTIQVSL